LPTPLDADVVGTAVIAELDCCEVGGVFPVPLLTFELVEDDTVVTLLPLATEVDVRTTERVFGVRETGTVMEFSVLLISWEFADETDVDDGVGVADVVVVKVELDEEAVIADVAELEFTALLKLELPFPSFVVSVVELLGFVVLATFVLVLLALLVGVLVESDVVEETT